MNQISPYKLWIGHLGDSRDYKRMFNLGIQALVTLAAEEANGEPPRDLVYCHFPLLDGAENEEPIMDVAIGTLASLLTKGVPTLVCCGAGMSRSPSLTAAALSISLQKPMEECLELIAQHHRSDVSPGLWRQIREICLRKYSKGEAYGPHR
jgi:protein-tyrosine phosphatase